MNPLNPWFKVISILYLLFMNRSLKQGGSDSFLQTLLWPLTLSPTCHFLCLLTRGLVRSWPERLIKLTSRHPNVNPPSGLIVLWHFVTLWQYLKMLVQWCRGDRCTIRESTPGGDYKSHENKSTWEAMHFLSILLHTGKGKKWERKWVVPCQLSLHTHSFSPVRSQ